jgi:hypothetical protein
MSINSLIQKPDYGLDAPGLVKAFLFGGLAIALICWLTASESNADLLHGLMEMGISFFASGLLMIAYSYYGKFRSRDSLIRSLNLKGNETLLDLGCGRGLLLIGAAKALPNGKAIGIDLWSQTDLSIREAVRVLKPGGKIALLDFKSTGIYANAAKAAGLKNIRRPFSRWCFPPSRIVYGEKPVIS